MSNKVIAIFFVTFKKPKTDIACTLSLTQYRIIVEKVKNKSLRKKKTILSRHYCDLLSIESTDSLNLTFVFPNLKFSIYTEKTNQIIPLLGKQFHIHSSAFLSGQKPSFHVSPLKRSKQISEILEKTKKQYQLSKSKESNQEEIWGKGYLSLYRSFCDYFSVPVSKVFVEYMSNYFQIESSDIKTFKLQNIPGIQRVNSSRNDLDLRPIFFALKCSKYFKAIEVSNLKIKGLLQEIIHVLENNTFITKLKIDGIQNIDGFSKFVQTISNNPNVPLESLDLSNNALGDTRVHNLIESIINLNYGIKELLLSNCNLTNKGIKKMIQSLQNSKKIKSSLARIDISNNNIGTSGSKDIAEWIGSFYETSNDFHSFYFGNCGLLLNNILNQLNLYFTIRIQALDISGSQLNEISGPLLNKLVRQSFLLRHINISATHISFNFFEEFISNLIENKKLDNLYLNLSTNNLGPQGAEIICDYLLSENKIKTLIVDENNFGIKGVEHILQSLISNTSVHNLSIAKNIKKKEKSSRVGNLLKDLIQNNKTLHNLNISGQSKTYSIGENLYPMFEALEQNTTIKKLKIEFNNINELGIKKLSNSLQNNSTLTSLSMDQKQSDHSIQSFQSLASMFSQNGTIIDFPFPNVLYKKLLKKKNLTILQDVKNWIEQSIDENKLRSATEKRESWEKLQNKIQKFKNQMKKRSQNKINIIQKKNSFHISSLNEKNFSQLLNNNNNTQKKNDKDLNNYNSPLKSSSDLKIFSDSNSEIEILSGSDLDLGFDQGDNLNLNIQENDKDQGKKKKKKKEGKKEGKKENEKEKKNEKKKENEKNNSDNEEELDILSIINMKNKKDLESNSELVNNKKKAKLLKTPKKTTKLLIPKNPLGRSASFSPEVKNKNQDTELNGWLFKRKISNKSLDKVKEKRRRSSGINVQFLGHLSNSDDENEGNEKNNKKKLNNNNSNNKSEQLKNEIKFNFKPIDEKLLNLLKSNNIIEIKKHIQTKNINPIEMIDQNTNWTVIHYACQHGNTELLSYFLSFKNSEILVNVVDDLGLTPLHLLMTNAPNVESIILLSDYEIDFNIKDKRGWNALQILIHTFKDTTDKIDIILLLLEKGSNPNQRDIKGACSIDRAANNGWEKGLVLLIQQGGDVNIQDNKGLTPLHKAARNGMVKSLQILLDNGAKTDIEDKDGNTALSLSRIYGQYKVERILDPENSIDFDIIFDFEDEFQQINKELGFENITYTEYTVLLIGTFKSGKTKLVERFHSRLFSESYIPTVENKMKKYALINHKRILVNIIDVSGDQIYSSFLSNWIKKADGIIMCYSVLDKMENFNKLNSLYSTINKIKKLENNNNDNDINNNNNNNNNNNTKKKKKNKNNIPICLVSLKNDAKEKNIKDIIGKEFAKKMNCKFIKASTKKNQKVDFVFRYILSKIKKKYPNKPEINGEKFGEVILKKKKKLFSKSFNKDNNENEKTNVTILFEDILKNELCLDFFSKFLKKEYAEENLLFYFAVISFKKIDENSSDLMYTSAQKIYNEFVSEKSPLQINIDYGDRVIIEESLKNKQNIDSSFFDKALVHILGILKNDSFNKFLKTHFYTDMINEIVKNGKL
ncbi:leucine-rich repeat [Anaeramoeba flamelloides]|uniref:Leucine-rich repeat n=1 Tax=Anaeramoeba flamelloides TaxID=1746091 RepID=A0ABQ8YNK8_9EUKA|nr:leucine-rich repeat [Anaeramoeba flamelloides]